MSFRAGIYSTRNLKPEAIQELHLRHLGLGNPFLVLKFALCEPRFHFRSSLPLCQKAPTEDWLGIKFHVIWSCTWIHCLVLSHSTGQETLSTFKQLPISINSCFFCAVVTSRTSRDGGGTLGIQGVSRLPRSLTIVGDIFSFIFI